MTNEQNDGSVHQLAQDIQSLEVRTSNQTVRLDAHRDRISSLERQVGSADLEGRVSDLADKMEAMDARLKSLKVRLSELEGRRDAGELEPEYSAPIGAGDPGQAGHILPADGGVVRHGGLFSVGDPARGDLSMKEAYKQGFSNGRMEQAPRSFNMGREVGIAEAEVAVQRLFEKHFSEATTNEVLRVIRALRNQNSGS